jgi:CO dehydrogenase/acetyl-CoA synthase beta subunit
VNGHEPERSPEQYGFVCEPWTWCIRKLLSRQRDHQPQNTQGKWESSLQSLLRKSSSGVTCKPQRPLNQARRRSRARGEEEEEEEEEEEKEEEEGRSKATQLSARECLLLPRTTSLYVNKCARPKVVLCDKVHAPIPQSPL